MYITVGVHPSIKMAGEITPIDQGIEQLTAQDTKEFSEALLSDEQYGKLQREKNLDFSFSYL